MKVLTIVGARPQFIKAALVSRYLEAAGIEEILVHTGQHHDYEMSGVFFQDLKFREPDRNLGVAGLPHGAMTGRMLERIEETLMAYRPDWVLVYGDTNSTLAGALAAAKMQIPLAHVEAGLRSFNRVMPEELNRMLTDACADLLLAPSAQAEENLLREGCSPFKIRRTADPMLESARYHKEEALSRTHLLSDHSLSQGSFVLATLHRQENVDHPERLKGLLRGLQALSERVPVVFPLHPRTRRALQQLPRAQEFTRRLTLVGPIGYLDSLCLAGHALLVATDSGGLQKEAYALQVPCLTLREETEWVELVEHGFNRIVGSDSEKISRGFEWALEKGRDWSLPLYKGPANGEVFLKAIEGETL